MGWFDVVGSHFALSLPHERFLILCIWTWFVASHYLSGECTNECQLLLPSPHPSWSLQFMMTPVCTEEQELFFNRIFIYPVLFKSVLRWIQPFCKNYLQHICEFKLWAFECICLAFMLTPWLWPGGVPPSSTSHCRVTMVGSNSSLKQSTSSSCCPVQSQIAMLCVAPGNPRLHTSMLTGMVWLITPLSSALNKTCPSASASLAADSRAISSFWPL